MQEELNQIVDTLTARIVHMQQYIHHLEGELAQRKESANSTNFMAGFDSREAFAQWLDNTIEKVDACIAALNS